MCDCSPDHEPPDTDPYWDDDDEVKEYCFITRGTKAQPFLICGCGCHVNGAPKEEWRTYKPQYQDPRMSQGEYNCWPSPKYR